jgi:hypothetical protein
MLNVAQTSNVAIVKNTNHAKGKHLMLAFQQICTKTKHYN